MEAVGTWLVQNGGPAATSPAAGEVRSGLYYRVAWVRSMARFLSSGAAGFGAAGRGYQPYYAAKACPLPGVLRIALEHGFGIECASLGEVRLALAAGAAPDRVLYGGPCKTAAEIAAVLRAGHRITCDGLEEVARVQAVLDRDASLPPPPAGFASLRINPQLADVDADSLTVTAHPAAKFGAPLDEAAADIRAAFARCPWLSGVHVHVGSQHVPLEAAVRGIRKVADFVAAAPDDFARVRIFDTGGGCPADYATDSLATVRANLRRFAQMLRSEVPALFDGRWTRVTEFGRVLTCKAAFVLAAVEYLKHGGGRQIAVTRVGAELFLRTAYLPAVWPHRVRVLCAGSGAPAETRGLPAVLSVVGGPACFSGDLIARDVMLPPIVPGDVVQVLDTGAYTIAMFSRFNSIARLAIYGIEEDGDGDNDAEDDHPFVPSSACVRLWHAAETPEDVARFWQSGQD